MTEKEVRVLVKQMADGAGGIRALAAQLGLSPSYVCDVCLGRRSPGPPFLKALRLRKLVIYESLEE